MAIRLWLAYQVLVEQEQALWITRRNQTSIAQLDDALACSIVTCRQWTRDDAAAEVHDPQALWMEDGHKQTVRAQKCNIADAAFEECRRPIGPRDLGDHHSIASNHLEPRLPQV